MAAPSTSRWARHQRVRCAWYLRRATGVAKTRPVENGLTPMKSPCCSAPAAAGSCASHAGLTAAVAIGDAAPDALHWKPADFASQRVHHSPGALHCCGRASKKLHEPPPDSQGRRAWLLDPARDVVSTSCCGSLRDQSGVATLRSLLARERHHGPCSVRVVRANPGASR